MRNSFYKEFNKIEESQCNKTESICTLCLQKVCSSEISAVYCKSLTCRRPFIQGICTNCKPSKQKMNDWMEELSKYSNISVIDIINSYVVYYKKYGMFHYLLLDNNNSITWCKKCFNILIEPLIYDNGKVPESPYKILLEQ